MHYWKRSAVGGLLIQKQNQLREITQKISVTIQKQLQPLVRAVAEWANFLGRQWVRRLPRWQKQLRRNLAFFQIDRQALAPYAGLLIITAFVLVGNQANQRALAAPIYWDPLLADVDPVAIEEVLETLDPLTPELTEDPEGVASLLLGEDDTYLSRPDLAAMTEAEKLSKKDPIPYVVAKGDTLVSIAKHNDRTVATILEANNIRPEDAGKISPGTNLLIPQEDTSHSLAWLEADQRARAEAAQKAAEQRAKLAKNRTSLVAATRTVRERSNEGFSGDSKGNFVVPIRHNGITRGVGRGHYGIDYRADVGTAVAAAAPGRVIETTHGWAGGFGISILVDHGSGMTTRYAHLSDIAINPGDTVSQGQVIGYSGSTGRSTGPHLHFETRTGGRAINPF